MRIGIDCRLWNETGVGRYIRNLVSELAKIDTKNSYILFFKQHEYTHVPLPGKNFEKRLANIHWHSLQEQFLLPSLLIKEQLDLMHFPYFSVPILYQKPFVVTIHDLIINNFATGKASTKSSFIYLFKRFGYLQVLSMTIKHAIRVIVPSEATKQEILQHYPIQANKITVTPEGVDKKIAQSNDNTLNKGEKYFLYVGNSYPHKNLDTLLAAWKIFIQTEKSVKLIFVGKADFFYKRLYLKVKELGITSSIEFKKEISDGELASLYSHAQALVMPSLMEGFGLPILEALATNCLVLASNIPAFHEIGGDTIIYFNPQDGQDIAQKLHSVLTLPKEEINRRKRKGIEQAKNFSWAKMAQETLTIYENCIGLR